MGALRLLLTACLFQLVVYSIAQTTAGPGLVIQSDPPESAGVVHTKPEQTVSLTCQSAGGSLAGAELQWRRNGALVSLGEDNKLDRSSLCVTPITREDQAAIFTCQLKGDASVNTSLTLNVTFAPLLSGAEEVSVEEEAGLAMECDVQANPPVSVSWKLNGDLLDLTEGSFTVTNDGYVSRLAVHRAERSAHQGTYSCVTESSHGTHSKSFHVTVTDKTQRFPLMPMIAGLVVVFCTILLAVVSRWKKITQCCK